MNNVFDKRNSRHIIDNGKRYEFYVDIIGIKKNDKIIPLRIKKPNLVALYLNIADSSYKKASILYDDKIYPKISNSKDNIISDNAFPEGMVLDLIENIVISIIFSYLSVESFINGLIKSDYVDERKIKGHMKKVDSYWIQKHERIEVKIKNIICKEYKIQIDFNTNQIWQNFCKLKKFRDELTHVKREIIIEGKSTQLDFLQNLVGDVLKVDIIESAKNLVELFSKQIKKHPNLPYEFCNDPIDYKDLISN